MQIRRAVAFGALLSMTAVAALAASERTAFAGCGTLVVTSITGNPASANQGQAVSFTAVVTQGNGAPVTTSGGTVTFGIGGTTSPAEPITLNPSTGKSSAVWSSWTAGAPGTYPITAATSGPRGCTAGSGSGSYTVGSASTPPPTPAPTPPPTPAPTPPPTPAPTPPPTPMPTPTPTATPTPTPGSGGSGGSGSGGSGSGSGGAGGGSGGSGSSSGGSGGSGAGGAGSSSGSGSGSGGAGVGNTGSTATAAPTLVISAQASQAPAPPGAVPASALTALGLTPTAADLPLAGPNAKNIKTLPESVLDPNAVTPFQPWDLSVGVGVAFGPAASLWWIFAVVAMGSLVASWVITHRWRRDDEIELTATAAVLKPALA